MRFNSHIGTYKIKIYYLTNILKNAQPHFVIGEMKIKWTLLVPNQSDKDLKD